MRRGGLLGLVLGAVGAFVLTGAGLAGAAGGFQVVSSPSVPGASLAGVGFVSASDGWTVGSFTGPNRHDGRAPLTEHWNGSSWSVVPAPDTQFNDDTLSAVAGAAANDVWAIGQRQRTSFKSPVTPLVFHWNGSAWSEVATPVVSLPRYSLSALKVISSTNVWAVGTTINGTLVEHWNGTAWSIVPSPNPAGTSANYLRSVSATGPNDVWAVGSTSSVSGANALSGTLVEHWNGTAWSIVSSPNVAPQRWGLYVQDQLTAVVAISPTNAWASGFSNDVASGSFLPLRTVIEHWNGTSWAIVTSPNLYQHNTLSAIAANGANDVWIVGNGWTDQATGVPVATPELLHWTGSAWASVTPPARVGTSDNIPASVADVAGTVWIAGNAGGVGPLILRGP